MALHFQPLRIRRVTPDAAGAIAITFEVPPDQRDAFDFRPGQFLTLRARPHGEELRRNYSICSPHQRYVARGEIEVGIKPVAGGAFSSWAARALQPGMQLDVMPPDGRFTPREPGARHRVGFAAGSGITPILSIMASTLQADPESRFTLVYGNQRTGSIMFNEALQDLKDRYPARVALVHVLSRQSQEVPLLHGRLDAPRVGEIVRTLVPAATIDEAFICGPEGMITAVEHALREAGVAAGRVHAERFSVPGAAAVSASVPSRASAPTPGSEAGTIPLDVVLDGKTHHLRLGPADKVLDVALAAGLDLPYSCKGGVCCTCRARVLEGRVEMEKNYTLEAAEMAQGFVLTCQSRALSPRLVVSYDER